MHRKAPIWTVPLGPLALGPILVLAGTAPQTPWITEPEADGQEVSPFDVSGPPRPRSAPDLARGTRCFELRRRPRRPGPPAFERRRLHAGRACLSDDGALPEVTDETSPAPGEGFWYVVREAWATGTGCYESGGVGQIGLRDAEIVTALAACP